MLAPRPAADRTATFVACLAVVFAAAVFGFGYWLREAPPLPIPAQSKVEAPRSADAPPDPTASDGAADRDPSQPLAPDIEGPGTATLDVHLHCAGEARLQQIVFAVVDGADRTVATVEQRGLHEEFSAVLTVPADVWLVVGATTWSLPDDRLGTQVMPVRTRLDPGQTLRIELQASAAPTTLRVVGPSPALLSRLTLEVVIPDRHAMPFRTRLLADGTTRLHLPQQPVRASLVLAGGTACPLQDPTGQFDLVARGGELVLTPAQPLVGIVVGAPDHELPAALSFDGPASSAEVSGCHLTTAAQTAASKILHGWTAELGPFTLAMTLLRRDSDLCYVDPRLVAQLASLLVHVAPTEEPTSVLDLLAEPMPEGVAIKLDRDQTTRHAALPAGDYRLVWNVRGGRGPIAVEPLTLRAGETTELRLQPPPLQRWTVRLRGALAESAPILLLKLGAVHSLGGARDGAFLMDLVEPPQRDDAAEVFSWGLKVTFPAKVVSVDLVGSSAEITSPLTDAMWCRVRAQPMANGRTSLRLQRSEGLETKLPAFAESDVTLPLLPGTSRAGCVLEDIDGRRQLVRWFRIDHGTPELLVQGSGRWTTLHVERPIVSAAVLAAGPDGIDAMSVFSVDRAGVYPIFVADGTRQFHIDLEPGGRVSLDANAALVVR